MPTTVSFAGAVEDFAAGRSTPSQFLQGCLARLDEREPELKAFVEVARSAAIEAAKQSDVRWRAGKPLSPVDGMPIGIKDIIETIDMPTGQGSPRWTGWRTERDAASVQALRQAGAIILGKTTTTEYATMHPFHSTTNPHDRTRTPGGSSSGSAAAVGAGILPAALGTQVVASTLRPASFCGCVGFKPSVGALNRSGSYDHLSQSCTGLLAATPADAWIVAAAIAERAGGDPGFDGLRGPVQPPDPRQPARLALLQTGGWERTTPGTRTAIAAARHQLERLGVEIVGRDADPGIEKFEETIADALALTFRIFDWEFRWPLATYAEGDPQGLSETLRKTLAQGNAMTVEDYRKALSRRRAIRNEAAELLSRYDAFLMPAATGAAPVGLGYTGDPAVTVVGSLLGGPAVTLPLLADEGLPLGLQLIGRMDEDADLMAVANWIWRHYPSETGKNTS
jgi:Asp-tRNA(Asn)/Glu-tRNA(Gln) amidotransferase A subunit family amidase